ncbi:DUF535 family protein [Pseudochrobactrum asaccharolyticum]|uniref:DUF535 domain-containing protein n=1 Tax=Pseudochrobactrum asaccharolyticum TaxID=354351 RepID=A0A366E7L9_9HYPH|nr:DUF535 family protein [Pseudochrobactrum asaccharolyticum]MBX8802882.1 DUF535 domain-containing protein [Ochrobactrum sp. MR28]MBX8818484.1 DUF535 domain-containing protein [Ochrobactrum sp. MR31]RBO97408.1 hypothetical protein DFR47_102190 [Pseudochrobactrum asaccharolyticum]
MNCYTNIPEVKKQSVRAQVHSEGLPLQIAPVQPITWQCVLKRALGMGLRLRFRKAAAFTLRLMVYPQTSLRWYGFLADFSRKHRLGLPHDDLIRKAIPNFFLHKASLRERVHWLQNHFALAGQYMAQEDLQQLWSGKRLKIAEVEGKRELYDLSLTLSDHAGARHEGGFTITLYRRRDQAFLQMLSFVFTTDENGKVTVAIGGFQGAKSEDAKRSVIDATRDLFGVRPKDALLLVAEGIAEAGGATHVLAVANDSHVINFRHSARREKMMSDLDRYWTERGGEPAGRFGYILPFRSAGLPLKTARRDLCKTVFLQAGRQLMLGGEGALS